MRQHFHATLLPLETPPAASLAVNTGERHPALVDRLVPGLQTALGRDNVEEVEPVMGGEDFAFMLDERPGAYILVGNGDTANVHHPEYNFNDEAIPVGASWFVEIAEQRLAAG